MGISVQDAGIAVEKGRYYLVNLNADPSLNEMLVYYLKVSSCPFFKEKIFLFVVIGFLLSPFFALIETTYFKQESLLYLYIPNYLNNIHSI